MKSDDKIKVNYKRYMDASTAAVAGIVVAAGSEIIGMSPLKSNSWVQLILMGLKTFFPKRKN
jgi:hypothetical protein